MDKKLRNAVLLLVALIVLTPLGLIASGTAFGEWNLQELKEKIGYVPSGLGGLSHLWNAPLKDYGIPGLGGTTAGTVLGYVTSAIVGVLICAGVMYILGKLAARNAKQ